MKVQGVWGPSGQAFSDMLFLLGFCVRIWKAVGESSPSLISLLSKAVGADADDTEGRGETPCQYSESHLPCGYSSSLSPEVTPALDSGPEGTV